MALTIESSAFRQNADIPRKYTCEGDVHKLYALDVELPDLHEPTKAQLETAMKGHIIAQAEIVGTYQKR